MRKKANPRAKWVGPGLVGAGKVLAVAGVLCGIVITLAILERYVASAPNSPDTVDLELAGVPLWVSDELKEKVHAVAQSIGIHLRPDEDTALLVQRNLAEQVAWLDDVRVKTTHDCLRVEARWRRPVALVKSGPVKFYVDSRQVVLDFVPMADLPIVEIKGLAPTAEAPPLGGVWDRDDLSAAIAILDRLGQMDRTLAPDKPLLYEIDRIDVSNYNGRKNDRRPHILLYAKDGTEITWGAELGKWQRYLESSDEQKLAKLYGHYKEYGTLSGHAKYINLCNPRDKIPLPIDRY